MKLDELKQTWQQENDQKSEQQLKKMMKQRISSVFSRIKLRAVLESIALLLVLLVFFTGLDAERNAIWVNILFAVTMLTGIVNNWVLYRGTTVNIEGVHLIASLEHINRRLQWQVGFAIAFSVLLFVGTFAFLLLRVPMTDQKLLIVLLVLPASIGIRTWFEVRQWYRNITVVRDNLAELRGS